MRTERSLTAEDVLSEIEFELAQGAISRNELGQAVQTLKRYQNELRSEILHSPQRIEGRQVVSRLFQFNDMMLTLLQETASAIQSVKLDLRRLGRVSTNSSARVSTGIPVAESGTGGMDGSIAAGAAGMGRPDEVVIERVRNAMRSEALEVETNVRPTRVPVVGPVIRRLRIGLHNLAVFYVNRFGEKQVVVNQTYGDLILQLTETVEYQKEQIGKLNAQVASIQARLTEEDRGQE